MCSDRQAPVQAAAKQSRRGGIPLRPGFSFIEIMVVVVIIGMLAGAVALKAMDYVDTAKINRAKSDIATIETAVEAYYLAHNRYPSSDEGLEKLNLKNRKDPWGRPYQYNANARGEPFEIFTYGADGHEGGEGANADIYSWQLEDVEVKE